MPENIFTGQIARQYDQADASMFQGAVLRPMVERLQKLAAGGQALELAIGTGRVALPLQQSGVPVDGIELSADMIAELRKKPGAEQINIICGDMATASAPSKGAYQLVFLVYNTITNLITQDEQVACFKNAAAHLKTGGLFVVEDEVPNLYKLPQGEVYAAFDAAERHIGINEYDVANQRLVSHHYWIDGSKVEKFSSTHRYAWPAEYDLMAKLAGMALLERWEDWRQTPYGRTSTRHVSVWQKTPGSG